VPRSPLNSVQIPAKANSGRSSLSANQTTSFFLVSGFGSGAYSAKLLAGTRQQSSGLSQARQWGEVALRISVVFFMSGPPVPGGGGCVVAYGRDACGCAVDCGAGSIGTGLRVEAAVGPGGGAEILDRRF
jgi:hypothetical protein